MFITHYKFIIYRWCIFCGEKLLYAVSLTVFSPMFKIWNILDIVSTAHAIFAHAMFLTYYSIVYCKWCICILWYCYTSQLSSLDTKTATSLLWRRMFSKKWGSCASGSCPTGGSLGIWWEKKADMWPLRYKTPHQPLHIPRQVIPLFVVLWYKSCDVWHKHITLFD